MAHIQRLLWLFTIAIIALIGWYTYSYFFDMTTPQIVLSGLEGNSYYAGDVLCTITSNKKGTISILLDGKSLPAQNIIKNKACEYSFTISTQTLNNGPHEIIATFIDSTFRQNVVNIACSFVVDNMPLQASLVQTEGIYKVQQGHTLHVKFQTNKPIKTALTHALSHTYPCVSESQGSYIYECFVPIACEEQSNDYILSIEIKDYVNNVVHLDHAFHVVDYPFKKQVIRVDQEKVKLEQEAGPSEKEFESLIAHLTKESPEIKLWRGAFCAPTDIQRISCEFGTIRTTQHKGRYAHKAIDIINNPRSVVWAPQDGKVVVKNRFAASGNTVVVDHGCGVLSMVFHLEDFADIEVGDKVTQGNPLGKLGKTGYATGYHLHWEHRVSNIPVDPLEWTSSTF